jgi:hypothetical protein
MKRLRFLLPLFLLALSFAARAQFGSFGDVPVEIDAENTGLVGGVAVADQNVTIRYGSTTIYCDHAEYNPDTRDVVLRGGIRVYQEGRVFSGERGLYNLETKLFRAADFSGDFQPFRFSGETISSSGPNAYVVRHGSLTTSDSSKPDYRFRAKGVRIYPKDRIVFTNVTLMVGNTPVFWWPYLYQSLEKDQAFTIAPGYRSGWGAYLLTSFNFPISDQLSGKFHFDLRAERGVAVGADVDIKYGKEKGSFGKLITYYAADSNPDTDRTGSESRSGGDSARYRVSFKERLFLTKDIYATFDINKLSDSHFLEDYFEGEFRLDPQPDNVVAVTKAGENYTLNLIVRGQVNEFQETTERLPEIVLDVTRTPLFNTPLFYEGSTGAGYLRRSFADGSSMPDYDYMRLDSFHQLLYPKTYAGWLSFIPRIGVRGTYYTDSGYLDTNTVTLDSMSGGTTTTTTTSLVDNGSAFRGVFNTGFESSFKFSREWGNVQSRAWGLEELRHIVQPYTNLSLAWASKDPSGILQIDRFIPNTQNPPIDFPQYTSVDSISDWSIWRWGVRNRWQTKRDNATFNWLEMDTFVDWNISEPDYPGTDYRQGTFSNLYNTLRWNPLPWVSFIMDSQLPVFDGGFTQVNTRASFMANRDLRFDIGHRFIDGNPFFEDSNLITFGTYYRINDNWAVSLREQYEMSDSVLESQRYEVHRDLSSWIASLGVVIRDNRGKDEFGILFTLTLKDFPQLNLPINLDPQGASDN